MESKVMNKKTRKRDGRVKITAQNQISIPRQVMRDAGLVAGVRMTARADGSGRVVLEAAEDPWDRFAGTMPGFFKGDELQRLRDEWER